MANADERAGIVPARLAGNGDRSEQRQQGTGHTWHVLGACLFSDTGSMAAPHQATFYLDCAPIATRRWISVPVRPPNSRGVFTGTGGPRRGTNARFASAPQTFELAIAAENHFRLATI